MNRPYIDIEKRDDYIIRIFDQNIPATELIWHRDAENRMIEVLNDNDWKIQIDNDLPVPLIGTFTILKENWHRVIKGKTDLKIKITFLK